MNIKKIALLWLLLAATGVSAYAQGEVYKAQLDLVFKSFQSKDYALLKPLIDEHVKIGTLPQGLNDAVLPQVLNQLPTPNSYKVTGTVKEGANTRVNTEYHYTAGNIRNQNFVFDAQNKIVEMDILGDAKVSSTVVAPVSATALPDRFEAPFEVHKHLIFMKANLNGREETFIMDCGAPLLVLNRKYFTSDTVANGMAEGVGGSVEMGQTHIQSFDWHGVEMKDFDAVTLSLTQLEKECHRHFIGLIGYEVFKDYEITYDYKHKIVTFVKTDADGNPVQHTEQAPALCTIPFEMSAHIAIIPVTISGKTYKVGIDCGASSNLLYAKYLPDLEGNTTRKKKSKLEGAGKTTTKVTYAKIKTVTAGTAVYKKMTFAFDNDNLTQLNSGYGLNIDGLIGYEFLKRYKTTVNYKKKEVRIYAQ